MGYDEDLAEELKANTGPKKASQTEMKWLNRLNGMVETALGVIESSGTKTRGALDNANFNSDNCTHMHQRAYVANNVPVQGMYAGTNHGLPKAGDQLKELDPHFKPHPDRDAQKDHNFTHRGLLSEAKGIIRKEPGRGPAGKYPHPTVRYLGGPKLSKLLKRPDSRMGTPGTMEVIAPMVSTDLMYQGAQTHRAPNYTRATLGQNNKPAVSEFRPSGRANLGKPFKSAFPMSHQPPGYNKTYLERQRKPADKSKVISMFEHIQPVVGPAYTTIDFKLQCPIGQFDENAFRKKIFDLAPYDKGRSNLYERIKISTPTVGAPDFLRTINVYCEILPQIDTIYDNVAAMIVNHIYDGIITGDSDPRHPAGKHDALVLSVGWRVMGMKRLLQPEDAVHCDPYHVA